MSRASNSRANSSSNDLTGVALLLVIAEEMATIAATATAVTVFVGSPALGDSSEDNHDNSNNSSNGRDCFCWWRCSTTVTATANVFVGSATVGESSEDRQQRRRRLFLLEKVLFVIAVKTDNGNNSSNGGGQRQQ